MGRWGFRIVRWLCLPPLFALALALAEGLVRAAWRHGSGKAWVHPFTLAAAGGFTLRWLWSAWRRRRGADDAMEFLDTLEHELTHALFGYLTLAPPVSLSATLAAGGEVELKGRNPLAVLAPYFFPLWAFLALALGLIVAPRWQADWRAFLYFLLGNFLYRLGGELRPSQPDLGVYGLAFSLAFIASCLVLGLALILHVTGALPGDWVPGAGARAWHWLAAAAMGARHAMARAIR